MTLEGRRVLFISYNGMLDPLGQSQVLPYLRQLAARGVFFTLLSFERAGAFESNGPDRCEKLRRELASHNIEWHWLRYHQRPSLPATAYDVIAGIFYAQKLVRRNRIEMVHARSHIPALIALVLKKRFGLRMIFDVRGLMAEEYVEAEHWRKVSVAYRLTKIMERQSLAAADGVVTLTGKIWPIIKAWEGLRGREVVHEVIPCCADLELFRFSLEDRARRRAELDLKERLTIVYSGSIGSWYLSDRMADFFAQLVKKRSDSYFIWLTTGDASTIRKLMDERGIHPNQYTVRSAASQEVSSYLSASDVGIAFYKPGFSKLATSPVKVTEYLACGLPLIVNSGIGDTDALIRDEAVGAIVSQFAETEFVRTLTEIESLLQDAGKMRARARAVAERVFDLRNVGSERYQRLYEAVLEGDCEDESSVLR